VPTLLGLNGEPKKLVEKGKNPAHRGGGRIAIGPDSEKENGKRASCFSPQSGDGGRDISGAGCYGT